MLTCDRCQTPVAEDEGQTVDIRTARQTRLEPAEYDTLFWCETCVQKMDEAARRDEEQRQEPWYWQD